MPLALHANPQRSGNGKNDRDSCIRRHPVWSEYPAHQKQQAYHGALEEIHHPFTHRSKIDLLHKRMTFRGLQIRNNRWNKNGHDADPDESYSLVLLKRGQKPEQGKSDRQHKLPNAAQRRRWLEFREIETDESEIPPQIGDDSGETNDVEKGVRCTYSLSPFNRQDGLGGTIFGSEGKFVFGRLLRDRGRLFLPSTPSRRAICSATRIPDCKAASM